MQYIFSNLMLFKRQTRYILPYDPYCDHQSKKSIQQTDLRKLVILRNIFSSLKSCTYSKNKSIMPEKAWEA